MWSQWNTEGLQILFHIYNGTVIIRFLNLFQLQLCIDSQGATLLYTTSVFWATRTNAQVKSLLWSLFPTNERKAKDFSSGVSLDLLSGTPKLCTHPISSNRKVNASPWKIHMVWLCCSMVLQKVSLGTLVPV